MISVEQREWIESAAAVSVAGPVEVVVDCLWSMVARVPTTAGPLWFKEARASSKYEAGLVATLATVVPGRVLTPIAADAERGWLLMPDGGPTLAEAGSTDVNVWTKLFADHAVLQQDLIPHLDRMWEIGVPDATPATILSAAATLTITPESRAAVVAAGKRLLDGPVPVSLQHDDLQPKNVFRTGQVFDWGDCLVAHPFGVLLKGLQKAADAFDVPPGDPLLLRLRDAYLEPWQTFTDAASLREMVSDALRLAKVGRAMSWERSLAWATPEEEAEYRDAGQSWLDDLDVPDPL
jgi:hypothetical protein